VPLTVSRPPRRAVGALLAVTDRVERSMFCSTPFAGCVTDGSLWTPHAEAFVTSLEPGLRITRDSKGLLVLLGDPTGI
jgi:hypothetical protein